MLYLLTASTTQGPRTYSDGRAMYRDIMDVRTPGIYQDLNPDERERALGYATGATAAHGISPSERHAITGRCMDSHAMESLMAICMALERASRRQFLGSSVV